MGVNMVSILHTHLYTHSRPNSQYVCIVMYRWCIPSDTHQRLVLNCGVGVASPADQWALVQGGAPQHCQWRERVCVTRSDMLCCGDNSQYPDRVLLEVRVHILWPRW